MPVVEFVYQGYARENITSALDAEGNVVDVSGYTSLDLAQKIQSDELQLPLGNRTITATNNGVEFSQFNSSL